MGNLGLDLGRSAPPGSSTCRHGVCARFITLNWHKMILETTLCSVGVGAPLHTTVAHIGRALPLGGPHTLAPRSWWTLAALRWPGGSRPGLRMLS